MDLYREPPDAGNLHRERFLHQARDLLDREFARACAQRASFFAPDRTSLGAYEASLVPLREQFVVMLGWPLTLPAPTETPPVRQVRVAQDALGDIHRLWIQVLPRLDLYGILFVPHGPGPHPLVLSQHGGLGTPELCSGFFGSANYSDMTRRVLRRGFAVFAPQLFRWAKEYGPEHDAHDIDRQLKQLGGSIAALELWCLARAIDYLSSRPDLDSSRIGMIGLSYGGFHTLFATAADTRIMAAVSSCFFSDRRAYGRGDWGWFDAANTFFDAQVASLVCPRALHIEVGQQDDHFDVRYARSEVRSVRALYEELGVPDRFSYKEHGGGHELDTTDDGIDFLCAHLTGTALSHTD